MQALTSTISRRKLKLKQGDRVRVVKGALLGMEGTVKAVNADGETFTMAVTAADALLLVRARVPRACRRGLH